MPPTSMVASGHVRSKRCDPPCHSICYADCMDPMANEKLLNAVEAAAKDVFPGASFIWDRDSATNNRLLRIVQREGVRLIAVTDVFLDADGGDESTLQRLQSWNIGDALTHLKPQQTLLVTNEGLRLQNGV